MPVLRRVHYLALGPFIGAAVALWIWHAEASAIAAGEDPRGAGLGASHLLFVLSLPWSLAVWAVLIAVGTATGADGPAFLRPFFYVMPVVAGAGWGWVASRESPARGPAG